jgi:uncharacterized protein (TIGR03067 family)
MPAARSRLALSALLLAAVPSGASPDPEPPADIVAEYLQWSGTFAVVRFQRDGRPSPEAELKTMKVVIKGADGAFHAAGGVFTSKATLFPDERPRQVDCRYTNGPARGLTVKGIYKVEGDQLTCCYADPGKARPGEFKAPAGSGFTLYTLRRLKGK